MFSAKAKIKGCHWKLSLLLSSLRFICFWKVTVHRRSFCIRSKSVRHAARSLKNFPKAAFPPSAVQNMWFTADKYFSYRESNPDLPICSSVRISLLTYLYIFSFSQNHMHWFQFEGKPRTTHQDGRGRRSSEETQGSFNHVVGLTLERTAQKDKVDCFFAILPWFPRSRMISAGLGSIDKEKPTCTFVFTKVNSSPTEGREVGFSYCRRSVRRLLTRDRFCHQLGNYSQYRRLSPNREIFSLSGELLCIIFVSFGKLSPKSWPESLFNVGSWHGSLFNRWIINLCWIMTECVSHER